MSLPPSSEQAVLVAASDRLLGVQLLHMIQKLGYSVQSVEAGGTASARLFSSDPPEIALLSDSLDGQSGLELAAELRRRPGRKRTWIVLLSATPNLITVAAAVDAGVDDLLLCPAGEPLSEMELRIRLSVASRMQQLARQLQEHSEAITFHASHDQLTGLWNRESLLSLLFPETDRVQRMSTPLAFLLLDIDCFAHVNEEYGYEAGDKILRELANRLRRYMRSYDLLGRFGEDEFLLALPGCNSYQARHLAGRIRTVVLRKPFDAGHDFITLTASIGLAQSRGRSPLVVLRDAERALATAKREGRNCEHEFLTPNPEATLKEQPA